MIDEWWILKDLEGSIINGLTDTEENHKRTLRIASVPDKIWVKSITMRPIYLEIINMLLPSHSLTERIHSHTKYTPHETARMDCQVLDWAGL
jgi:hypothetical protein